MKTKEELITDPVVDVYLAFALNLDSLRFAVKAELHSHDISPTDSEVDSLIGNRLGVGTTELERLQSASSGVDVGYVEIHEDEADPTPEQVQQRHLLVDAIKGVGFPTIAIAQEMEHRKLAQLTSSNPSWAWDWVELFHLPLTELEALYKRIKTKPTV